MGIVPAIGFTLIGTVELAAIFLAASVVSIWNAIAMYSGPIRCIQNDSARGWPLSPIASLTTSQATTRPR